MAINTTIIRDYLWEIYSIDQELIFNKETENLSDDEKYEHLLEEIIRDLFTYRLKHDPGLALHISREIEHDLPLQREVVVEIIRLLQKNAETPYPDQTQLPAGGVLQWVTTLGPDFDLSSESFTKYQENRRQQELEKVLEFFKIQIEYARQNDDPAYERVINALIDTWKTGFTHLHKLVMTNHLHPEINFTDEWLYKAHRFFLENLKFRGIYSGRAPKGPSEQFLLSLIPANYSVINETATLLDLNSDKFKADAPVIAAQFWFDRKTLDEKIAVLNGNFPFSVDNNLLTKIFQLEQNETAPLTILGYFSFQNGFFLESACIHEFVLRNTSDNHKKFLAAESAGIAYRENGDYDNALKFLLIAEELAEKISGSHVDRLYRKCIEQKNVGEICFHKGDYKSGEGWFNKAESNAIRLPKDRKNAVLYNLAKASRRACQFEKEYNYLNRLIEHETHTEQYETLSSEFLPRIHEITQSLTRDGKISVGSLTQIEVAARKKSLIQLTNRAYVSFQYDKVRVFMNRAYELSHDPYIHYQCALIHSLNADLISAEKLLESVIKDARDPSLRADAELSLALIKISIAGKIAPECQPLFSDAVATAYKASPQSHDGIFNVLTVCIWHFLKEKNTALLIDAMSSLIEPIRQHEKLTSAWNVIGYSLMRNACFPEARVFFKSGIDQQMPDTNRADLLYHIGLSYHFEGQHKEAIEWIDRALALNPNHAAMWHARAIAYKYLLNFTAAHLSMERASGLLPDNQRYRELVDEFDQLKTEVVNIDGISSPEVKKILFTAEWMILKIYPKDYESVDVGPVLVQYGKAMERLLHQAITKPICDKIHAKYGEPIPDELWFEKWNEKEKKWENPTLPGVIRSPLGLNKRTIPLGGWKGLKGDLRKRLANKKRKKDPISEFYLSELDHIPDHELETIGKASSVISELRNGAAHYDIKTREEVLQIRHEVVEKLNLIIPLVARISFKK